MSDLICVTNRKLCKGDFFDRIEEIARTAPCKMILREKDLSEAAYKALAQETLTICRRYGVTCVLHSFKGCAMELGAKAIHLPLPILRNMSAFEKTHFTEIGASCHSLEDALEAERLGCTYIVVGHIFSTDCKRGIPPRGLTFLSEISKAVSIPVYAIGGIGPDNISSVLCAGAKGGCVMSGLMKCENVADYMEEIQNGME